LKYRRFERFEPGGDDDDPLWRADAGAESAARAHLPGREGDRSARDAGRPDEAGAQERRAQGLELDDGTCISETVSICRYFDEVQPDPPLFGKTPKEKALVDMWVRRVEFMAMNPVGNFWRHAHPRTAALLTQFKDFGESNKATYQGAQKWLDRELDGKPFVAGDSYSMADICLLSTVDFAGWIGLPLEADFAHLNAWHQRVSDRPSAKA